MGPPTWLTVPLSICRVSHAGGGSRALPFSSLLRLRQWRPGRAACGAERGERSLYTRSGARGGRTPLFRPCVAAVWLQRSNLCNTQMNPCGLPYPREIALSLLPTTRGCGARAPGFFRTVQYQGCTAKLMELGNGERLLQACC